MNNHLKRSKRQYDKAISKGYKSKTDSIYQIDSIFVDRVRVDTLVNVKELRDTFTITKDRLITKLLIRNDSILVESECQADTIIENRLVEVNCDPIFIKQSFLESIGIDTIFKKILFSLFSILFIVIIILILTGRIV